MNCLEASGRRGVVMRAGGTARGWPTIYFPPCLRHDFDCLRGQGGWDACLRFYRLQRAYGVESFRSGIRTAAVTLAWYGWMKWRNKV
ncbi:MAG: hypothetical protein PHR35_18565 [Kiritimatiellae bacterium]|nr:hypothetical protein [Kiritimatiellia bacterium]